MSGHPTRRIFDALACHGVAPIHTHPTIRHGVAPIHTYMRERHLLCAGERGRNKCSTLQSSFLRMRAGQGCVAQVSIPRQGRGALQREPLEGAGPDGLKLMHGSHPEDCRPHVPCAKPRSRLHTLARALGLAVCHPHAAIGLANAFFIRRAGVKQDSRKCQTSDASPAEPGDLPTDQSHCFSGLSRAPPARGTRGAARK